MVTFKNQASKDKLIVYLKSLKRKQKAYANTEQVCYSCVSLYLAFKNNLFFENFMTHPCVLLVAPFFEEKFLITTNKELENILLQVLEYEFNSENEEVLTTKELNKVIKIYNRLKIKNSVKKA